VFGACRSYHGANTSSSSDHMPVLYGPVS
jgi:hypothetical protein